MVYKKIPRISRRDGKQIGWRWEFRKYNKERQRNEPVPINQISDHIRHATDEEIIKRYCLSKNAEEDSVRYRAKIRAEWREKHQDYEQLLDLFAQEQCLRAPNSWKTDIHYLEKYAFHFFLSHRESNNVLNWSTHYGEFVSWLRNVRPLKWNRKALSLNTQNKIIKALNVFLEMVARHNDQLIRKCPHYKRAELARVSAKDLFEEFEIKLLQNLLREIREPSHDFFTVLARTGLRRNEALGLSFASMFEGPIRGKKLGTLRQQLEQCGLGKYFGYICLESQPTLSPPRTATKYRDRFGQEWSKGSVPRKPLKLRGEIDPAHFRIIPVFDRLAWNVLVTRRNQQLELLRRRIFGVDPRDYLLFNDLTQSMFYGDLVKACAKTKLRFRSPHKLRHTFLTWFYDKTNENRLLAKKVAGHYEERSMQVYSHLAEQLGLEQALKRQTMKRLKAA